MDNMTPAQAQAILEGLFIKHGLAGWRVTFNTSLTVAGLCHTGTKTITVSTVLLAARSGADSYDILLHELAHALTPGCKHNATWRAKLISLGGDGKRCFDASTVNRDAIKPAPYTLVCTTHGVIERYYRKPKHVHGWFCRKCGRDTVSPVWHKNNKPM